MSMFQALGIFLSCGSFIGGDRDHRIDGLERARGGICNNHSPDDKHLSQGMASQNFSMLKESIET